MNSRSSYFSRPSGREILTSKLEDLKRDHEKQMGDETKVSHVRSRSILITNLSINSKQNIHIIFARFSLRIRRSFATQPKP